MAKTDPDWVLYHNPRCAQSRRARAFLAEHGIEPVVIEYLKEPPTKDQLRQLADQLGGDPILLLRNAKKILADRAIDSNDSEAVLDLLAAEPLHLQRPIVLHGERAMIARPPDKLSDWL